MSSCIYYTSIFKAIAIPMPINTEDATALLPLDLAVVVLPWQVRLTSIGPLWTL